MAVVGVRTDTAPPTLPATVARALRLVCATMECHDDPKQILGSRRVSASRATRLLEQLIRRQLATGEALATFLGLPPQRFETYLAGEKRLPLESQRRLADLIGTTVPELAREALRLKLQCDAEELFHSKETQTHMTAPPSRFR